MLGNYLPVLIFLVVASGLAAVLLGAWRRFSAVLSTRSQRDARKLSPYECGFEPFEDTRMKFDVRYYLVAILFIVFDLEIAFLFPWAVAWQDRRLRTPRHGHVPRDPGGRLHLRVEERSARMGVDRTARRASRSAAS